MAALAFAVAAYMLMCSALQTLSAEGDALWMLYTLPRPMALVLRDKAVMWGALATLYPLAIFVAASLWAGAPSLERLVLYAMVLLGVPIYAVIATAFGVLGYGARAQGGQRKINSNYVYLYMLLVSLYTLAFYASTLRSRAAILSLTVVLALALWQKARDQLPYLLDPTASPPPSLSLWHGLIAALVFFVLQDLIAFMLLSRQTRPDGTLQLFSVVLSGALTFAGARLSFWGTRMFGLPRIFGPDVGLALRWGLGGGVVAALAGMAHLAVLGATDQLSAFRGREDLGVTDHGLWIVPLGLIAAPVFEEFIFRGLVFGGLRRSMRPGLAIVASAAVFAAVQPLTVVAPAFALAICTAVVYQRSGLLLAPIVSHVVYNAALFALAQLGPAMRF
jgi:membrane protease YdiL (CAAX protease family)